MHRRPATPVQAQYMLHYPTHPTAIRHRRKHWRKATVAAEGRTKQSDRPAPLPKQIHIPVNTTHCLAKSRSPAPLHLQEDIPSHYMKKPTFQCSSLLGHCLICFCLQGQSFRPLPSLQARGATTSACQRWDEPAVSQSKEKGKGKQEIEKKQAHTSFPSATNASPLVGVTPSDTELERKEL
ncbi:hypothetical protein AMECASPLE_024121 [Ameca splendens]|uniref:Uncharacterized protein n=1 Tax=Ameca splendens TaxID=208324 RepID=A0ABV0YRM7_9TELE